MNNTYLRYCITIVCVLLCSCTDIDYIESGTVVSLIIDGEEYSISGEKVPAGWHSGNATLTREEDCFDFKLFKVLKNADGERVSLRLRAKLPLELQLYEKYPLYVGQIEGETGFFSSLNGLEITDGWIMFMGLYPIPDNDFPERVIFGKFEIHGNSGEFPKTSDGTFENIRAAILNDSL